MSTQAEIDLEARIGELERQLAELSAKVNPLYSGGFDRFIHSGYIQWDGIGLRLNDNGIQVLAPAAGGVGIGVNGMFFVSELVQDPGLANDSTAVFPRAALTGFATESVERAAIYMAADGVYNETQARVRAKADNNDSEVAIQAINGVNAPNSEASITITNPDGGPAVATLLLNGTSYDLSAGGGSMPMPPVVSTMSWHCVGTQLAANAVAAAASAAWPIANTAVYIPLLVTEDITVKKLWWLNGATASGNVNMALYTAALAQVSGTETTSTAQSGTNVIQEVDIADTALTAGMYYMAIVMDNTTGTMFRYTANAQIAAACGVAGEVSVFDLPATATLSDPIVSAAGYVPVCGIATRTQVA